MIGECSKCGSKVKISHCGKCVSIRFIVEDDNRKSWHLTAFNEQVDTIILRESGTSIEEKILMANKMKFFLSNSDVVKHVNKV